ncbi:MAG: hypothetical protein NDF54_08000 [archaeon GB-1867-035]|nr:hypothetical protein [Candidatus Culexmicrobium profundum]
MSYQDVLERLGKLYEFRDLVVSGRRRGYLERDEVFRLVSLLRELVNDISGAEARLTLNLLDVVEELASDPGPFVKQIASERFGRDDVLPMPEILAESLPELPILNIVRESIGRGFIGRMLLERMAHRLSVSPKVLKVMLNVRLKDFAHELGYLFESLLYVADNYAKTLERYVTSHGVGELRLTSETLSVFAEVVARAWLSIVLKGPWIKAEPLPLQRSARCEFDAVSIERVEDRVEIYVAEIEVKCCNFLKLEGKGTNFTRIEKKMHRLKKLLNKIENVYNFYGARKACLAKLVLICFDDSVSVLRERILSKARTILENLCDGSPNVRLCPSFSLKFYTGSDMLQCLGCSQPENRLRQAIEYIRSMIA